MHIAVLECCLCMSFLIDCGILWFCTASTKCCTITIVLATYAENFAEFGFLVVFETAVLVKFCRLLTWRYIQSCILQRGALSDNHCVND